jgi:energy-coupling factor transporter ATP-binding protein EcfA2
MGSIQLMVLLFRLATKMAERAKPASGTGSTIIVEEPEQNLHPKLQSKLADLFFELNKTYGFNFIIETHSEYLVRRSQVIVANENKKAETKARTWGNPFRVYYFPADGYPYDMEYAKDGYFEKPFGKGFFNVSSELSLDLDRIEQGIFNERQN